MGEWTWAVIAAVIAAGGEQTGGYLSSDLLDCIWYHRQAWGSLGLDTAVVPPDGRPGSPLRIGDRTFSHGLGTHAHSDILVRLDGAFEAFQAEIGILWQQGDTGTVVFRVFVDEVERFNSGVVRERDPARPVRVDLRGADELRLEVTDAGDGITCDCAIWADARLIAATDATPRSRRATDLAPFAQVVATDPARIEGTRAGRVEEFPAADVFLSTPLRPDADGLYRGHGAIGLEWFERRHLRELGIGFAETPPAGVECQVWQGESWWQGAWRVVETPPRAEGTTLWWTMPSLPAAESGGGTQKVRWIVPPEAAVRRLRALSVTSLETVTVAVGFAQPAPGRSGEIEVYNGFFPDGSRRRSWDLSTPLELVLDRVRPNALKLDATALRFELPTGAVAVRIDDIFAHEAVWLPKLGLYLTRPGGLTLAEYKRRLGDRATVLDHVRAAPEQTFEAALRSVHREVQDNGPTMLSLAADNHKFVADRDGTVGPFRDAGLPPKYVFRVVPRFGPENTVPAGRHLAGGWLPAPTVVVTAAGVRYRWTTYVAPWGGDEGGSLWHHPHPLLLARCTAENRGDAPALARVRLDVAVDHPEALPDAVLTANGARATLVAGDTVRLAAGAAGPWALAVVDDGLELTGELAPGETASCDVLLPAWSLPPDEAAALFADLPDLADLEAYWRGVLAEGLRLDIPDPLLSNVILASQVHCLIAARQEADGERIAPWIGSDRYGPLESEGQAVIQGLDLFGHHDFARRCHEFYIARYNPQGFLTTGYTIVGTGWHLWTLAEHYFLTGDRAWLAGHAAEVARLCEWVDAQRRKTRVDPERLEYGLQPPGVAADWGMYCYRYFNAAHFCAGLRDAAAALSEVGAPGAEQLAAAAREFADDIVRSFRRTSALAPAKPLSNGCFQPGVAAMANVFGDVGEWFPGADWNRSWANDVEIGPHHLVALGVLSPFAPETEEMLQILEDDWFLRTGMGEYPGEQSRADPFGLGGFAKIQPYYGRVADIYAQRDEVRPFLRAYFNAIPSLLNRENLSFWEHFHNIGGWNKTHETGGFLRQTRLMFVTERGDELWLAPFLPAAWMADGRSVVVERAPTRFGRVSYRITSHVTTGRIEAEIDLPERATPATVALRLRHPNGRRLRRALVNGAPAEQIDPANEVVYLRGFRGRVQLEADY